MKISSDAQFIVFCSLVGSLAGNTLLGLVVGLGIALAFDWAFGRIQ